MDRKLLLVENHATLNILDFFPKMTMVNEWLLKSFLSQEHCDDRKK